MVTPSSAVLDAFAIDGDPVALPGGEGMSLRVGDCVVKRVHDANEAEWTQELLSRTEQVGFRIPEPVQSRRGHWVYDGWSASRFIPDLRSAVPFWSEIATAGLRFADAVECARDVEQKFWPVGHIVGHLPIGWPGERQNRTLTPRRNRSIGRLQIC